MCMKLILSLSLVSGFAFSQNTNDIIRIEFSSITRGHQEFVVITKDSISVSTNKQKAKTRELEKKEWAGLVSSVNKLELSSIASLKSPTMKRAYDGAKHSTLTITTQSQSYSHAFDDENPHEKLRPILKLILEKKKKLIAK